MSDDAIYRHSKIWEEVRGIDEHELQHLFFSCKSAYIPTYIYFHMQYIFMCVSRINFLGLPPPNLYLFAKLPHYRQF